jgi:ubiquinone/menaquinone biosynthesis C-methylase UbiE
LEIGFGSGIVLPELARHTDGLYGVDIHDKQEAIGKLLARAGVSARLYSADAASMPFEDDFLDAAVAISAVEFFQDLDAACVEVARVLKPSGVFFVVTPGDSRLLDLGLKVLTGRSAARDFEQRRSAVIPTLLGHFRLVRKLTVPGSASLLPRLFTGLELAPRT